jgi:predicted lipoprotein with Yx(FWY)xxD motif
VVLLFNVKKGLKVKRNSSIAITVIALLIVIGGAYAIFHKSKPMSTNSTATASGSKAVAVSNSVLVTKTSSSLGQYLAEPDGQALYTYGNDSTGVSNCTGSCLASWPAYQDTGSTSGLPSGVGTIKRTDNGEIQYTYNGMPLYSFVGDSNGNVTGNGVSDFSVAKPAATSTSTAQTTSTSSSSSGNW